MNEDEFAELAAGHALHALSDADERAFASARASHPEWEHHVRADEAVAGAMADAVPELAPSPAARAALLAQIAAMSGAAPHDAGPAQPAPPEPVPERPAPTAGPHHRARRTLSRRGLFALAASLVVVLAVGIGALVLTQRTVRPPAVVALEQIEQAPDAQSATAATEDGGEATVHWSDTLGESVIVTDGFPALAEDRTFELWFVRGETPIPAGTFAVDESGQAVALLTGEQQPGDIIAVTIEQAGGSPDGLPTTEPIIAITT